MERTSRLCPHVNYAFYVAGQATWQTTMNGDGKHNNVAEVQVNALDCGRVIKENFFFLFKLLIKINK